MNSRKILLLGAALFLVLASGCAVAARKAKSALFGSRGTVRILTLKDKTAAEYQYVMVERFTTDFVGVDETLVNIRAGLIRQINEDEDLNKKAFATGAAVPGSPALRIQGELLDYDEGSKIKRAMTIGGQAYIIMRYTIKDARTGETLAVFNSGGFVAGDIDLGGTMDDVISILNQNVICYLKGELHEMMRAG
jgi:hypothetical protein